MVSGVELKRSMSGTYSSEDKPLAKKEVDEHELDVENDVEDVEGAKPRKKRRLVQTSDKKYECPEPDCGKKYSRAEHLYRHQLNRMCRTFPSQVAF